VEKYCFVNSKIKLNVYSDIKLMIMGSAHWILNLAFEKTGEKVVVKYILSFSLKMDFIIKQTI
jgi:hypothetical protein